MLHGAKYTHHTFTPIIINNNYYNNNNNGKFACVRVCMCVRVRERERESVCVCGGGGYAGCLTIPAAYLTTDALSSMKSTSRPGNLSSTDESKPDSQSLYTAY